MLAEAEVSTHRDLLAAARPVLAERQATLKGKRSTANAAMLSSQVDEIEAAKRRLDKERAEIGHTQQRLEDGRLRLEREQAEALERQPPSGEDDGAPPPPVDEAAVKRAKMEGEAALAEANAAGLSGHKGRLVELGLLDDWQTMRPDPEQMCNKIDARKKELDRKVESRPR